MNIIEKIKGNMFLRNAVLAVCVMVILIFLAQIFLTLITRHGQIREVPDFGGTTVSEAQVLADKASLELEINDSLYLPMRTGGIILEQNPVPGSKVKSGRRIFITVNSFKPKMAQLPYVAGYSLRQAKNNLDVAGFEIDRLVYTEDIATNNVLEQKYDGHTVGPNSNIEAPTGSGIILVVGVSGEVTAKVPKVVGFPLNEAKSRIWELGLNVGKIVKDKGITEININEAKVYRQSPNTGNNLILGTPVDLFLTLDAEKVKTGGKNSDRMAKETASEQSINK